MGEELAFYEQILSCTRGNCECEIGSQLERRREEERVHQFLIGLDDIDYEAVRSNLLASEPLPPLNRVYSTLIQEECAKVIAHAKEEPGEIMGRLRK